MVTKHADSNKDGTPEVMPWADPVAKLLGAFAAICIPIILGIYTQQQNQNAEQARIDEINRDASRKERELVLQTLVAREQSSATLKAQMFNSLLERYVNTKDDRDRLLVLELLAINFPEDFRLRPVFERWYGSLPESSPKRLELRQIARKVAERQVGMISDYGGQQSRLELPTDGKPFPAEALGTSITFKEFTDAGIRVSVGDGPPLEVGFFDAPFLDQSRRSESFVYSLLLDEVNRKTGIAKLLIVVFPSHYYQGGSRLSIDQYIGSKTDNVSPNGPKQAVTP